MTAANAPACLENLKDVARAVATQAEGNTSVGTQADDAVGALGILARIVDGAKVYQGTNGVLLAGGSALGLTMARDAAGILGDLLGPDGSRMAEAIRGSLGAEHATDLSKAQEQFVEVSSGARNVRRAVVEGLLRSVDTALVNAYSQPRTVESRSFRLSSFKMKQGTALTGLTFAVATSGSGGRQLDTGSKRRELYYARQDSAIYTLPPSGLSQLRLTAAISGVAVSTWQTPISWTFLGNMSRVRIISAPADTAHGIGA
jgi:hypothetical protein